LKTSGKLFKDILHPECDLFCAVYPYSSWNGMAPLNQAEFRQHVGIIKEVGFKGVLLWNLECFYDENLLDWSMELCRNESLEVLIPIQYFNRSENFPFPTFTWAREGFMTSDTELNVFADYLGNVSEIVRNHTNFRGYIFYYPFNSSNLSYWEKQIVKPEYAQRLRFLISSLKDDSPLWLSVELWKGNKSIEVYEKLPKDFSLLQDIIRGINGSFSTFSGSLCFFLPLSAIYFLYFWMARDEIKERPKLKRIIWLYLIPASFPITLLILLILYGWSGALMPAIVTSMILIIILAAIGEISSE
jgi:hypothetical protein